MRAGPFFEAGGGASRRARSSIFDLATVSVSSFLSSAAFFSSAATAPPVAPGGAAAPTLGAGSASRSRSLYLGAAGLADRLPTLSVVTVSCFVCAGGNAVFDCVLATPAGVAVVAAVDVLVDAAALDMAAVLLFAVVGDIAELLPLSYPLRLFSASITLATE